MVGTICYISYWSLYCIWSSNCKYDKFIMRQEDKNLLIQDLCCRLPYRVKVKTNNINILELGTHTRVGEYVTDVIEPCKPYLFPLSSMTDEQEEEYNNLNCWELGCFPHTEDALVYLIANHFDYRGLIPKGLAIDATGLNIY